MQVHDLCQLGLDTRKVTILMLKLAFLRRLWSFRQICIAIVKRQRANRKRGTSSLHNLGHYRSPDYLLNSPFFVKVIQRCSPRCHESRLF